MRRWALAGLCGAAGLAGYTIAEAQAVEPLLGSEIPFNYSRGRNISVLDRPHPEYDALGIQVGGFTLFPQVETGIGVLDNVFGTQTGKVADGFVAINPTVMARSDWGVHALTVQAGARLREFFTQGTENENGWFVQTDGRLDATREDAISLGFSVRQAYEERESGGYPVGAATPVQYLQSTTYLRATHEGARVRLTGSTDLNTLNYSAVDQIGGGQIEQNTRDRLIARTGGRVEYGFTPDTSLFGQIGYARTAYRLPLGPGIPNRDSNEGRILAGASFDFSALMRGVVGLGYVRRDYDASNFGVIQGLVGTGRLEYFPTQLITLTLSARRLVEDSIVNDSAGYFNNGLNLRADYELLRNVIISSAFDVEYDQYASISRNDTISSTFIGAAYSLTRTMRIDARASYLKRDTSGSAGGLVFDETRALVSLVLKR